MKTEFNTPLELCHADTCLPDYWSGHHRAHLQIPVYRGMTMRQIKQELNQALNEHVSGSEPLADTLNYAGEASEADADQAHKRARAAINRMKPAKPNTRRYFMDLEAPDEEDDGTETIYAFFVFMPKE